jgi:hypothetical protein
MGTVEDPSRTNVDPPTTVVAVALMPIIDAIAEPILPSAADEMIAFALDSGTVETPFTTTLLPVACKEYVDPSTVIGGPPGIKLWVARAAGAVRMEDISAARLAAGIVEPLFTTTPPPTACKENSVPETVIGDPPATRLCDPITRGLELGRIAVRGTVDPPFTTTLLPDGSRERMVPETVIGAPPGVNDWDPMTGGDCGVVEGDGAPGSCAGVVAG